MPLFIAKCMRAIVLFMAVVLLVCSFIGPRLYYMPFAGLFFYISTVISKEIREESELND